MTAPLPVAPAEQTEPQPDEPQGEAAAVLALLGLWLASSAAVGATVLPAYLAARLVALGLEPKAVAAAGRIALGAPIPGRRIGTPNIGPTAARTVAEDEPRLRALFVWNAAKRLTTSLRGDVAPVAAFRNERRHFQSSLAAAARRAEAAARVDVMARTSPWMEWTAVLDERTTPDCRKLHGRVFTVDAPLTVHGRPVWPGSVHGFCRCLPRPFGTQAFRAPLDALPTIRPTAQPIGV